MQAFLLIGLAIDAHDIVDLSRWRSVLTWSEDQHSAISGDCHANSLWTERWFH